MLYLHIIGILNIFTNIFIGTPSQLLQPTAVSPYKRSVSRAHVSGATIHATVQSRNRTLGPRRGTGFNNCSTPRANQLQLHRCHTGRKHPPWPHLLHRPLRLTNHGVPRPHVVVGRLGTRQVRLHPRYLSTQYRIRLIPGPSTLRHWSDHGLEMEPKIHFPGRSQTCRVDACRRLQSWQRPYRRWRTTHLLSSRQADIQLYLTQRNRPLNHTGAAQTAGMKMCPCSCAWWAFIKLIQ